MAHESAIEAADGLSRGVNVLWQGFDDIQAHEVTGDNDEAKFQLNIGDSRYEVTVKAAP